MTPAEGALYGLVQGVTEFLPVSSSAHLVLLPWAFGWQDPGLAFDVALHAGTLLAVLWYFAHDWIRLGRAGLSVAGLARAPAEERELLFKLVVATIPAIVAGVLLEDLAESIFRSPALVATNLAVFGLLLGFADRRPQTSSGTATIGWTQALAVGAAQALAIVPGVSRSGITITTGRFLGLDRETAARFSFLLSTPITAGAVILKARVFPEVLSSPGEIAAVVSSAAFGFLAIAGLLRWVRGRSYDPFVVYRVLLALVLLATLARA